MFVYRIEDGKGLGAFTDLYHYHDHYAFIEGVRTANDHPSAFCDGERGTELAKYMRGSPGERRFGCRSKHQLRMWFRSAQGRDRMAAEGGIMVTYWVPDQYVKHGRYQVLFNPEHATPVSTVAANQW